MYAIMFWDKSVNSWVLYCTKDNEQEARDFMLQLATQEGSYMLMKRVWTVDSNQG